MVFQHSGGRDFDLPRDPDTLTYSHYSGVIPMVFQHSGGRDFDLFPDTLTTQGLSLWCFNIVARRRARGGAVSSHSSGVDRFVSRSRAACFERCAVAY